jgi:hypothetical protein
MAPVIKVPGSQRLAGAIISCRTAPTSWAPPQTRKWRQRIEDDLTRPCTACGLRQIQVARVSFTMGTATCVCGSIVEFNADAPATRVESPREKKAALALRIELKRITSRTGSRR